LIPPAIEMDKNEIMAKWGPRMLRQKLTGLTCKFNEREEQNKRRKILFSFYIR
jgi:hypothetical protein